MIDPEVNLYVIREADGIVSNLDCHNIKIYEESIDKLFYLVDFDNNNFTLENNGTANYNSYSEWLFLYKYLIENDFFRDKQNIYDLLAGTFSFKLKINKDFYYEKINNLHIKIESLKKKFQIEKNDIEKNIEYFENFFKVYPLTDVSILTPKLFYTFAREFNNFLFPNYQKIDNSEETIFKRKILYFKKLIIHDNLLNIGFDEILLLDIFKELISINITSNISNGKYNTNHPINIDNFETTKNIFLCDKYDETINIEINNSIVSNELTNDIFNENIYNKISSILKCNILNKINIKNLNKQNITRRYEYREQNMKHIKYLIDLLLSHTNIKDNNKFLNIIINIIKPPKENYRLNLLLNEPFCLNITMDKYSCINKYGNIFDYYLDKDITSCNSQLSLIEGGKRKSKKNQKKKSKRNQKKKIQQRNQKRKSNRKQKRKSNRNRK